jgi:FkbM family methyltransferase
VARGDDATTPDGTLVWRARAEGISPPVTDRAPRNVKRVPGPMREDRVHRLRRRVHHIAEAFRHRRLIRTWAPIVLGYTGLRDLRGGATIELASGMRFAIAHASDAWTIVQVIGRNDYRVGPSESWRTVIDIGANIGTFAVLAARAAPAARVLCFEPAPDTAALLRRNVTMNGIDARVLIEERAVSGAAGRVDLVSPPQSSIRRVQQPGSELGHTVRVEAVTLPDIFDRHAVHRCDFLKIDCEGGEFDLLRACPPSVLGRVDRIALEFHEWQPGDMAAELQRLLLFQGFRVEHVCDPVDPDVGYLFADRPMVQRGPGCPQMPGTP